MHVELDFESVGQFDFIAATHFFAFDDELFWESSHYVSSDVCGYKCDRQTIGAFHFFPLSLFVEFDNGAVAQQHFVFKAVDIGKVDYA